MCTFTNLNYRLRRSVFQVLNQVQILTAEIASEKLVNRGSLCESKRNEPRRQPQPIENPDAGSGNLRA